MILSVTFLVIIVILYLLVTRKHNYWKVRGVKYEEPAPMVGSIWRVFKQNVSLSQYLAELYQKYPKEKFVGYFGGSAISLLVRDPELVKHVLVTDFQCFYPRGLNTHKTVIEPMMKNLFFADGDLWKLLRQRMTPAFTSGKLKAMFPLIVERTERLQRSAAAKLGSEVDVRDLMARYTTDFIGACGFGMDTDSITDDKSPFRDLGKRIFTPTLRAAICSFLKWTFPETFKHLHITASDVTRDTIDLVKTIMQERNYKPVGRNDFIDLLFELRAKGVMVGESLEKRNADGTPKTVELELDELLMAAQVFVFFAAGFETSSSATSYTLHQLALHPDQQAKCQQEIDEVLARHDGKLCYDAVKEMKYLHMCFKEGMRMFPSLGFLIRQCVRPYTFPGTDVTIDGGVYVLVSVQGLHNDEQYFKDPAQFRPERFAEGAPSIPNHVYLPFGEGPRACIGGDLWKLLRQRLTPAFTSGKLKAMFPLIVERTERLQRSAAAKLGSEVDVRDLMARYTTDFIGACGFGIDTDSINDDTSTFRQLGKSIFNPTKKHFIISALKWIFPEKLKHYRLLPLHIEQATLALVKGIMMKRNYKPSARNDFIDLLLELREKGTIVGESLESRNDDGPQTAQLEMDEVLMAAQVFVFFAAGFETSSSATSYTLHQLAMNPDQQVKCQQEIDNVLARYDGKLCYDAVKEMKYLEMCFKEGMRMLPSLGFLIRQCVRPYTFPGTDVSIDAGVYVLVSTQGLHNDEQYFGAPDQFHPERFSEGANIPKHVYLPFGEGPRACIGERLGLMQSLAGLAALLRQCSVAPSAGTRAPRVDPASFIVQNIDGGLPLSLVSRKIQSDVHVK
ncbi:cytochrome P450 6B7-like [Cydia amplana]|uniref:cytochrome P450 6B7-like n=1 Tax=Cydia amplana TaxID=1869771 RepID=UPI002FE6133D